MRLLLVSVFFANLALSSGDKCPYNTFEYKEGNVCYIVLKWEEVFEIRQNIWNKNEKEFKNYVGTKDEAFRMCQLIANITHAEKDKTNYWKKEWNQIPGPDVPMRLPMPKTKEHLEFLLSILYDAYTDADKKKYRGRMFLGITKTDSPDLVPAAKTPYEVGDCGYLYRADSDPYYANKDHHGLHWVNCTKPLPKPKNDIDNTNMEVGCEFDMPNDCQETKSNKPGCSLTPAKKCVEMNGTIEKEAHRLGQQCTVKATGECSKSDIEKICKRDCQRTEWTQWNKCKCPIRTPTEGTRTRSRTTTQDGIYGGTKCEGPNNQKENCTCGTYANLASKFLIGILILVALYIA